MPLTAKGSKILAAMTKQYGGKKGKSVFYASINAGKVKGVEGMDEGGIVDTATGQSVTDEEVMKRNEPLSPVAKATANFAGEATGINDAMKAYRGEMTEDEQKDFALQAGIGSALGSFGKGAMAGKGALAALGLLPKYGKAYPKNYTGARSYFIHQNDNIDPVGTASISYSPQKKEIHVDWIGRKSMGAEEAYRTSNTLGTKEMMSFLRALKQEFPEAELISGYRVSGARDKVGGGADDALMAMPGASKEAREMVKKFHDTKKMKEQRYYPEQEEFQRREYTPGESVPEYSSGPRRFDEAARRRFEANEQTLEEADLPTPAQLPQSQAEGANAALHRQMNRQYSSGLQGVSGAYDQNSSDATERALAEIQRILGDRSYADGGAISFADAEGYAMGGRLKFAEGGPTPPPITPAPMPAGLDPDKMARLMALQRQIMQGRPAKFSPIRGNDIKGNLAEVTAPVTAGRMNPEGWQAFLDQAPESQNIEDRRGLPLTEREALFRSGRDQLREQLTRASGPYDQYVKQATESGRPNLEMLSKIAASMAEGGRTPTQEELINAARAMAPEYIKIMERYKPPAPVKKFWGGAMMGQGQQQGSNPWASMMQRHPLFSMIQKMRDRMAQRQQGLPQQAELLQQAQGGSPLQGSQHPMLAALSQGQQQGMPFGGNMPFQMPFGMGRSTPAAPVASGASPEHMAQGGYTNLSPPWYARHAMKGLGLKSTKGFLNSAVPGRTDRLPLDVAPGSYVVPADIVSALGQGNSMAGAKMLKKMFSAPRMAAGGSVSLSGTPIAQETKMFSGTKMNKYGGGRFRRPGIKGLRREQYEMAEGGEAPQEDVPIIAAGGEFLLSPDEVATAGGHNVLDAFVKSVRKEQIATLRNLRPPKKD